jgi:hypothetical protein
MGGHLEERRAIERQALDIVAAGLVTRLAAMVQAKAPKDDED